MRAALVFAVLLPLALGVSACAVGTATDATPLDVPGDPTPPTTDKADGGANLGDLDASPQHPARDAAVAADSAPAHDGSPASDASPTNDAAPANDGAPPPADAATDTGPTGCSGFAPPQTLASCHCASGHTCTINGCYNMYYCDTTLVKCVKKPVSCP